MIKAVLFDLDGVLVDAKEWHKDALNLALQEHGYLITEEEHHSKYDGLPTKTKLEILHKEKGLPRELFSKISEKKAQYTNDILVDKVIFNLDIFETITRLNYHGYKLAICSNSIRDFVVHCAEKLGIRDFVEIISNQDVKNPKPDPEIYLKACEMFSILPKEALVLEDNINGITSAMNAGCNVLIIKSPNEIKLSLIKSTIEAFN